MEIKYYQSRAVVGAIEVPVPEDRNAFANLLIRNWGSVSMDSLRWKVAKETARSAGSEVLVGFLKQPLGADVRFETGDWIVREVDGQLRVVSADRFSREYFI